MKLHTFLIVLAITPATTASVIEYTDADQWKAAAANYTTIDFVVPPDYTPVTNQYSHLGVNFVNTYSYESSAFLNDGWGIDAVGGAWVHFDSPQRYLAIEFPGRIKMDLYSGGALIHASDFFWAPISRFAGVFSARAFDTVYLHREGAPDNIAFIDDLYFAVPAPPALALLVFAALTHRRRRTTAGLSWSPRPEFRIPATTMKPIVSIVALFITAFTSASVVEYTDADQWKALADDYTTIDFIIPPNYTPVTDQYSHLGVHFANTYSHESSIYHNDGWGVDAVGGAWVHFDSPQHYLALEFPGAIRINLYSNGTLVHASEFFMAWESRFVGVASSEAFDTVYLHREGLDYNIAAIDDLYFAVPAPPALALLVFAALTPRRRRTTALHIS